MVASTGYVGLSIVSLDEGSAVLCVDIGLEKHGSVSPRLLPVHDFEISEHLSQADLSLVCVIGSAGACGAPKSW